MEHSLGEEPPWVDFIVWLHDEGTRLSKRIYNIIQKVVEAIAMEEDEVVRNHLRVVLNLISDKNPERMDELVRRDVSMSDKLFEICKPRIDMEKKKDLFIFVQDGQMAPEYAAGRVNQPVAEQV